MIMSLGGCLGGLLKNAFFLDLCLCFHVFVSDEWRPPSGLASRLSLVLCSWDLRQEASRLSLVCFVPDFGVATVCFIYSAIDGVDFATLVKS